MLYYDCTPCDRAYCGDSRSHIVEQYHHLFGQNSRLHAAQTIDLTEQRRGIFIRSAAFFAHDTLLQQRIATVQPYAGGIMHLINMLSAGFSNRFPLPHEDDVSLL